MAADNAQALCSHLKLFRRTAALTLTTIIVLALSHDLGPSPAPLPATNTLDEIRSAGVLKVITRRGYATWYDNNGHSAGFEHDLVQGLAKRLGVRAEFHVADTPAELISRLADGEFHLGAGSLSTSSALNAGLTPSGTVISRRFQLIQHKKHQLPESLGALAGHDIVVPSGSNAVAFLQNITATNPLVRWQVSTTTDTESLLRSVNDGNLNFTIADTDTVEAMQQHLPNVIVAHTFQEEVPIAWAFHNATDPALEAEVDDYFSSVRRHGELSRLEERYFDPARHRNYYDLRVFRKRIADRLPIYRHLFIKAGHRYNIDWRLLAALSYQESQWNPSAESYTGVRGIMQLTRATAKTLDVDRENVPDSIMAAARYISMLDQRLDADIDTVDRMWMALASYNIGPGHLDDAREITSAEGGNADSWRDVKRFLPLLRDPAYHSRTRFGRARGDEAVHLVTRVRSFYDVLLGHESNTREYDATAAPRRTVVTTML